MKKKVILYQRVSSPKQIDGMSFETQRSYAKACCEKFNLEIVHEFKDEGVSAFHIAAHERGAIKDALEFLAANPSIHGFLFLDESRCSRSGVGTDFYYGVYLPVLDLNPTITFYKTSTQSIWDPHSIEALSHFQHSHYESNIKSMRTKANQEVLLALNKSPGAPSPYGYEKEDGHLIINEERAQIVYFLYVFASMGYSNKALANILNQLKIPSPKGGDWGQSTIEAILKNRSYVGDFSWKIHGQTQLFENHHPTIIPEFLWMMVQDIRAYKNKHKKWDSRFLLGNLLYCNTCESMLDPKNQNEGYYTYKCEKCEQIYQAEQVHKRVLNGMQSIWNPSLVMLEPLLHKSISMLKNEIEKAIQKIDQTIQQKKYEMAVLSKNDVYFEAHLRNKEKIVEFEQNKKNILVQELDKLRKYAEVENMKGILKFQLVDFWQLTGVELRVFYSLHIKKVLIDPVTVKIIVRKIPYPGTASLLEKLGMTSL